jgi:hypothetical protein
MRLESAESKSFPLLDEGRLEADMVEEDTAVEGAERSENNELLCKLEICMSGFPSHKIPLSRTFSELRCAPGHH